MGAMIEKGKYPLHWSTVTSSRPHGCLRLLTYSLISSHVEFRARSEEDRSKGIPTTSPYLYQDNPTKNIYTFAVLTFVGFIFNYLRSSGYLIALVRCSRVAHNSMFKAVLKAPIYFFDTNPIGKKPVHFFMLKKTCYTGTVESFLGRTWYKADSSIRRAVVLGQHINTYLWRLKWNLIQFKRIS